MNRPCTAFGTALAALVLILSGTIARAAPPTVVPSPGYDARLEEQRGAARSHVVQPTPPPTPRRHHRKRTY